MSETRERLSPAERTKRDELRRLMLKLNWDRWLHADKYYLLDLVGKTNDAAGNWSLIAQAFALVGGDPDELRYLPLRDNQILIMVGDPHE